MNEAYPISIRLEELYKALSSQEKRELTRFLDSPYFNRVQNLLPLHRYFSSESAPDKIKAWKAVFRAAPYNEKKFRYLVSDLIASMQEFIFLSAVIKSKRGFTHILDEYFTTREAPVNKKSLGEKIKSGRKARQTILSPEYFLENYYEEELLAEIHKTSVKEYSRYIRTRNSKEPSGLDAYYIAEKLREICSVVNDNNVLGVKNDCFYEKEILRLAASDLFAKNPLIGAYLNVRQMLTERSESAYFSLKQLLDKHGYDFEDKSLAELFLYARNFCIGKINAGQSRYFEELFSLYEQGLSKRVLLLNGEINQQNFKNIVTTGLRIGRHPWVFDFINDYRYKLNKSARENAFNYNLANYFFHTCKFEMALQSLQKVALTDLFYGLDARSMMLKCYYELSEYEAFLNAYYSFRQYVQRKKNVSEQHRRNYLNFLRIAKKLMNLRPRDKRAALRIQSEIQNQKALADKSWLEEKIAVYL